LCLPADHRQADQGGQFAGFLAAFGVLFAASGIGNGSTFRMISSLFVAERVQRADSLPSAQAACGQGRRGRSRCSPGLCQRHRRLRRLLHPKSVGSSLAMTGSASAALVMFIVFYLSCIALTWWAYSRRNAPYPC
jgi:NNP family nitrate/nitrite transporter-like MFS transporter